MKTVFVLDDDPIYQTFISSHLKKLGGYEVKSFTTGEEFMKHLDEKPWFIVLDYNLGGELNGVEYLRLIKEKLEDVPVIFLSGQNDIAPAVDALKFGSFDYIKKDASAFVRLRTAIDQIEYKLNNKNNLFSKIKGLFTGL